MWDRPGDDRLQNTIWTKSFSTDWITITSFDCSVPWPALQNANLMKWFECWWRGTEVGVWPGVCGVHRVARQSTITVCQVDISVMLCMRQKSQKWPTRSLIVFKQRLNCRYQFLTTSYLGKPQYATSLHTQYASLLSSTWRACAMLDTCIHNTHHYFLAHDTHAMLDTSTHNTHHYFLAHDVRVHCWTPAHTNMKWLMCENIQQLMTSSWIQGYVRAEFNFEVC